MNENELNVAKDYIFDNSLNTKIDSIIDSCHRDCHKKHFHIFKYRCIRNIIFTDITNNETVNFTISDKNMGLFELNKKLNVARGNRYKFN